MNETDVIRQLILTADKDADADAALMRLCAGGLRPGRVFEMDAADIMAVTGLSRKAAQALDMVDELSRYVYTRCPEERPRLDGADRAGDYFSALLRGRHVEYCYAACLDGQKRLLRCVCVGKGGFDASPVYVRDIAQTVMRTGARYAVLAHNHPGGTRVPSREDVFLTLRTAQALRCIGAELTEHLIVTRQGYTALVRDGYVKL